MKRTSVRTMWLLAALSLGVATPSLGQSARPWGRVSFMAQGMSATQNGEKLPGWTELVGTFTFTSPQIEKNGIEFRLDLRTAGYPGVEERDSRTAIYDGYIGARIAGGALGLRAGQMWLNELGGLGSLGGGVVEFAASKVGVFRRVRIGGFGGLEPEILDLGYVGDVTKGGGYVALEGQGAWRHVVGFVTIRNAGATERSVITTTNFLPIGRSFLAYVAGEYDLQGPGGQGSGGLTYFFTNARYTAGIVELQGTFHRGRSIDWRTITTDHLKGVPVSQRALDGLLYESAGGRVTVTVVKNVRVFGGYARDKTNRDEATSDRLTFGVFATDLIGTGLDVRVSDARVDGPLTKYDAWDVSVGRNIGPRVYVTADYASSLSTFHFSREDGLMLETRPRMQRFGGTGLVNLTRMISLLLLAEALTEGEYDSVRWMSGITFRF